ncbi:MAG: 7-carboxy-7-deazaguanine synthase QueE [Verrucomicrobiaceae bacterium]|nr:7-carboxy-7-deazaguanine synthase QueE [Verrucomicrobiaceae bacterium]
MLISEIFYSVQGEGTLAGVPSVFVRTSGCNLRCRWCDTPYASWQPEGREMNVDELLDEVNAHPTRFVVVTGGEPMVAKEMPRLLQRLREAGKHITIETAGTIAPEGVACDLVSISPKLAHSTPDEAKAGKAWVGKHERLRLQPEVLRAWCSNYDFQLKFVIASEADVSEVKDVIESVGIEIPPEKVLLMPEGITQEALKARQMLLVDICKREGWRYSPRLHIDLFGNKRGT